MRNLIIFLSLFHFSSFAFSAPRSVNGLYKALMAESAMSEKKCKIDMAQEAFYDQKNNNIIFQPKYDSIGISEYVPFLLGESFYGINQISYNPETSMIVFEAPLHSQFSLKVTGAPNLPGISTDSYRSLKVAVSVLPKDNKFDGITITEVIEVSFYQRKWNPNDLEWDRVIVNQAKLEIPAVECKI